MTATGPGMNVDAPTGTAIKERIHDSELHPDAELPTASRDRPRGEFIPVLAELRHLRAPTVRRHPQPGVLSAHHVPLLPTAPPTRRS